MLEIWFTPAASPILQSGTATAKITIKESPVAFSFELEGMGERQDTNYDTIKLYLNGNEVGSATAPGGGEGCLDGPAIFTPSTDVTLPICFEAGSRHTFQLVVDTVDGLYHIASYYQARLTLAQVASC